MLDDSLHNFGNQKAGKRGAALMLRRAEIRKNYEKMLISSILFTAN